MVKDFTSSAVGRDGDDPGRTVGSTRENTVNVLNRSGFIFPLFRPWRRPGRRISGPLAVHAFPGIKSPVKDQTLAR